MPTGCMPVDDFDSEYSLGDQLVDGDGNVVNNCYSATNEIQCNSVGTESKRICVFGANIYR